MTKTTYRNHTITAKQNREGLWTLKIAKGTFADAIPFTRYTSLERGLKAVQNCVDMKIAADNWDRATYRGKYAK